MKKDLIYISIIIIIFSSCVTKKTVTEYKDKIVRDSIYITKDRFITKAITDTLFIDNPCDSITGQLKDFQRTINTNTTKIDLSSVKGKIRLSVNIDSLVNERVKEYKSNFKSNTEIKEVEVVKYKTPFTHWLVHIICGLLIYLLIRLKV